MHGEGWGGGHQATCALVVSKGKPAGRSPHTPFLSLQLDRKSLGCQITLRIPCSTDNDAIPNCLLNLFESRGGLNHLQTIKVNYMGKHYCHNGA